MMKRRWRFVVEVEAVERGVVRGDEGLLPALDRDSPRAR